MNDIDRLRMTPTEKRAAKVGAATLLACVGLPLLYLIGPLILAAAFSPLGPLVVGGGIVAMGALALFAAMNDRVQQVGTILLQIYLYLFLSTWRSFFITKSEDEVVRDALPELEDPAQKTRGVIDRLRGRYQEALGRQQELVAFIASCEEQRARFAQEAERQTQDALAADERNESREAQRLVQKAAINQGHADGFAAFIASMQAFQANLQKMTDQLDLDITQIEGELALQTAALRGIDLREEAAEAHFGEDGQGDGMDAEAQMALIELSTAAELREAEIETRMTEAGRTLSRVDIRNIAGSQAAIDQLSGTFTDLGHLKLPARREVSRPVAPVAETDTAPTSPGDQGESLRRARIRQALAGKNKQ